MAGDRCCSERDEFLGTNVLRQFIENAVKPLADEAVPEITIVKSYPSSAVLNHENYRKGCAWIKQLIPYFDWLGVAID